MKRKTFFEYCNLEIIYYTLTCHMSLKCNWENFKRQIFLSHPLSLLVHIWKHGELKWGRKYWIFVCLLLLLYIALEKKKLTSLLPLHFSLILVIEGISCYLCTTLKLKTCVKQEKVLQLDFRWCKHSPV